MNLKRTKRTKIGLALLLFGLAFGCKKQQSEEAIKEGTNSNLTSVDTISSYGEIEKKESN